MKLLLLGGTGFLGPHTVNAALAAGHEVTLFNRGKTNSTLFPDIESLHGDRDPLKDNGLTALRNRKWDVVIDICGYVPRLVKASADLLANQVDHYIFISTISVYSDLSATHIDENSPVGTIADPMIEKITGETYGPLKVLCEQAVETALPDRAAHIRPGLIVGPGDSTDRFTYWPVRVNRGGEVLAPGSPVDRVQIIDARDLARFIIHVAGQKTTGVVNAVGPQNPLTIGEMLNTLITATDSKAKLNWVESDFLIQQGIKPWRDIPLWIPDTPDSTWEVRAETRRDIMAAQPAPFPEELAERAIKLLTYRRDLIVDPFDGSGTATAVARRFGRRFIGIDRSPVYCKLSQIRTLEQVAKVEPLVLAALTTGSEAA